MFKGKSVQRWWIFTKRIFMYAGGNTRLAKWTWILHPTLNAFFHIFILRTFRTFYQWVTSFQKWMFSLCTLQWANATSSPAFSYNKKNINLKTMYSAVKVCWRHWCFLWEQPSISKFRKGLGVSSLGQVTLTWTLNDPVYSLKVGESLMHLKMAYKHL